MLLHRKVGPLTRMTVERQDSRVSYDYDTGSTRPSCPVPWTHAMQRSLLYKVAMKSLPRRLPYIVLPQNLADLEAEDHLMLRVIVVLRVVVRIEGHIDEDEHGLETVQGVVEPLLTRAKLVGLALSLSIRDIGF